MNLSIVPIGLKSKDAIFAIFGSNFVVNGFPSSYEEFLDFLRVVRVIVVIVAAIVILIYDCTWHWVWLIITAGSEGER